MRTQTREVGQGFHPAASVAERKSRPVLWWASLGAAVLLVELTVVWRWIASGNARPAPIGATGDIPSYMKVAVRALEIGGVFAFIVFVGFFLVRPWRRTGRISTDGIFCIGFFLLVWQDPFINLWQPWFNYNGYFVNFSTWLGEVPTRLVPHPEFLVEPLLMNAPIYVYLVFGMAIVGSIIMKKTKARYPSMGPFGLVAVCYCTFVVFDFILEPPAMLLGLWVYPGSIKSLTLFHGHYYQFPIYEPLLIAVWWTVFACLRYFRNDKGHTLMERGIDRVRGSERFRTSLRLLACIGILNAAYLIYNIPAAVLGLHSSAWPEDIVRRPYFTTGYCGPPTDRACPGPGVPIQRPGSSGETGE